METAVMNAASVTVNPKAQTGRVTRVISATLVGLSNGKVATVSKDLGVVVGDHVIYNERLRTKAYKRDANGNVVMENGKPVTEVISNPNSTYNMVSNKFATEAEALAEIGVLAKEAALSDLKVQATVIKAQQEAKLEINSIAKTMGFDSVEAMLAAAL